MGTQALSAARGGVSLLRAWLYRSVKQVQVMFVSFAMFWVNPPVTHLFQGCEKGLTLQKKNGTLQI
jgi:hypothetical protein